MFFALVGLNDTGLAQYRKKFDWMLSGFIMETEITLFLGSRLFQPGCWTNSVYIAANRLFGNFSYVKTNGQDETSSIRNWQFDVMVTCCQLTMEFTMELTIETLLHCCSSTRHSLRRKSQTSFCGADWSHCWVILPTMRNEKYWRHCIWLTTPTMDRSCPPAVHMHTIGSGVRAVAYE